MRWSTLSQQFSDDGVPPLLSLVLEDSRSGQRAGALPAKPESPLAPWRDVPAADRRDALMSHLAGEAIRILGLPSSHYVDPQESLLQMGMDSLMAVEFRNRLHASFGRALPSTLVFDYPTIESLAGYLLDVVAPAAGDDLGAAADPADSPDLDALLTRLEEVSEEEAQAILSQRMAKGL
jgi:acyl carrier protein